MLTQLIVSLGILLTVILLSVIVGREMKKIYANEKSITDFINPLDRLIYRFCKIDPTVQMNWKTYLKVLLSVQFIWFLWGFVILLLQGKLFLNPAGIDSMEWTLALNSTISFLTSTNLQHYSGETGASYFAQVGVFMLLQFLSAATSLCAGVAVVRGLAAQSIQGLGNFYSDFVKSSTRILLPLSMITATFFLFNGVPMTFDEPEKITSVEGREVVVSTGPAAVFLPIKELGSNGGGFFGTNCAHPFENPNFFTYIIHTIIVWLLPMSFIVFVGRYLNNKKFSRMLLGVMLMGFVVTCIPLLYGEMSGNPKLSAMGIDASLANMEGKEVRFGTYYSSFYSAVNMIIPAGTITGMHDSYMPLSSIGMFIGMQVDAFFGGLGTGWINMFIYLIIATFIGSLMVGRTPELFGRKISIKEVQVAVLVNLCALAIPLLFSAIAVHVYLYVPEAVEWLSNTGPHGFTTIVYEYVSSMAGNGSGFEGLADNTPFWNLTTSVTMLAGRFIPMIGAFLIIGYLSTKKAVAPSLGTLRVDSGIFGTLLFMVIMILTVMSMFIVFALGPVQEHLLLV
ncbi:potassium-transporting ATPase subunit KdpA [Flavobacterium sp. UGB4466]|uniref:potassium-transporting ATPase subunit KdpA n=1 Tax=Flavobacterium sp. UGB4466 TaxID=2730889 RepID=UPI00192CA4EE|nr:potassium-transporting ATPase subunit KdpA [Flavobacterium sp. UGB4466]